MFKWSVLAAALAIAGCAGWFSISGIGQIFAGASLAAMIMAGALEIGKLVTVSFAYRYWQTISRSLRLYFATAAIILTTITSTGIYGYLSAAYATQAAGLRTTESQIAVLTTKQASVDQTAARLSTQLTQTTQTLQQQEQRLDQLVGKSGFITQQRVVQQQNARINELQVQLTSLSTTRDSLEQAKGSLTGNITTSNKIGTFYYVAQMLGVELDTVITWFILAIVLVFDPLAVSLIVAYNLIVREENTRQKSAKTDIFQEVPISEFSPPETEPVPAAVESEPVAQRSEAEETYLSRLAQ